VAAYHCLLVSDRPCDFVTPAVICAHVTKNQLLCECAVDLVRKKLDMFRSPEIVGGLISAFTLTNSEKPLLLLCELAQRDSAPFIEFAPKWMATTQNQAVSFLKILIIIAKSPENWSQISSFRPLPTFVSEILKCGGSDSFIGVCWFLCQIPISPVLWRQLDRAAVFHLLGQKLKLATETLSVAFAANAFQKLATVNYSSGFGVVVQVLLKRTEENTEAAPNCIRALGELVKYKELQSLFRLFNAQQTLARFVSVPELREVVGMIVLHLRA
jgi:hypothetical protein